MEYFLYIEEEDQDGEGLRAELREYNNEQQAKKSLSMEMESNNRVLRAIIIRGEIVEKFVSHLHDSSIYPGPTI